MAPLLHRAAIIMYLPDCLIAPYGVLTAIRPNSLALAITAIDAMHIVHAVIGEPRVCVVVI